MRFQSELTSSNPRRIPGLDGIRAIAFLLVLCGHSGIPGVPNGLGVTIFFFLSGYLITTLLRQEWIATGSISISRFYIRRAFRIIPPLEFGIAFAALMAVAGLSHSNVPWKAGIAAQFFFVNYAQNLFGPEMIAGLSVLWSLAVEEHFYLLFPWVYLGMLRAQTSRMTQGLLFASCCFLVLAWRVALMTSLHASWYRVYTGTDTRIDSILFGSLLAIVMNPVIDHCGGRGRRFWGSAAAASFMILLCTIAIRDENIRQTFRYTLQGMTLFPIFIYVIQFPDTLVTKFLNCRFLIHIGELSYSLYLVHYTVLTVVAAVGLRNPVIVLLLTSSVSYLLARWMHRFIEAPSQGLRNRLLQFSKNRLRPVVAHET